MASRTWALIGFWALTLLGCAAQQPQPAGMPNEGWTLASPNGAVTVQVRQFSLAGTADFPAQPRLYYRAFVGGGQAGQEVISWSPLGLIRKDEDFADDLRFVAQKITPVVESYSLAAGKRSRFSSRGVEAVLSFETARKARLDLVVRVFDDGFAFRYRFPEANPGNFQVARELTGFRIPSQAVAFLSPRHNPRAGRSGTEREWMTNLPVGTPAPMEAHWGLPALFALPEGSHWLLVAEPGLEGQYCESGLNGRSDGGLYRIAFPHPDEDAGRGSALPSSSLPWATPWRMVIASDRLGALVESSLATDLASAPRVAWAGQAGNESWRIGAARVETAKQIDWAARAGWPFVLVDAGWSGAAAWMGLAREAEGKGVHLLVSATADVNLGDVAAAGLKGVRIPGPTSTKQEAIRSVLNAVEAAGKHHLMVEIDGRMPGAGWQRTYPNLINTSAWRSETTDPVRRARQNVMDVFTWNVLGIVEPMPVGFSPSVRRSPLTWGHVLGNAVVFESGHRHFVDGEGGLPKDAAALLVNLPASWDETRFLAGDPDRYAVIARRKDSIWYVGAISADASPNTLEVPLAFMGNGAFEMDLIADGPADDDFLVTHRIRNATDVQAVRLRPYGGFAMCLRPAR
jgi:hypothetical protein